MNAIPYDFIKRVTDLVSINPANNKCAHLPARWSQIPASVHGYKLELSGKSYRLTPKSPGAKSGMTLSEWNTRHCYIHSIKLFDFVIGCSRRSFSLCPNAMRQLRSIMRNSCRCVTIYAYLENFRGEQFPVPEDYVEVCKDLFSEIRGVFIFSHTCDENLFPLLSLLKVPVTHFRVTCPRYLNQPEHCFLVVDAIRKGLLQGYDLGLSEGVDLSSSERRELHNLYGKIFEAVLEVHPEKPPKTFTTPNTFWKEFVEPKTKGVWKEHLTKAHKITSYRRFSYGKVINVE